MFFSCISDIILNLKEMWCRRRLISFLAMSRQKSELFRTNLGRLWLVLGPVGNILIYYLMFVIVFRASDRYGVSPFLFIMLGQMHFFIIGRTLIGSTTAFLARRNLLMQVKIEPLVFYGVIFREIFFEFLTVATVFWIVFIFQGYDLNFFYFILYYPLSLFLLALLSWSLGLLIATVSVFVKDFQNLSRFIVRIMMYASPVLYALHFIPTEYHALYMANPLATIFGMIHSAIFNFPAPSILHITYAAFFVTVLFVFSHTVYNSLKIKFTKVF